jgi:uncharacterized protein YpiB (UPF0302 family)
MDFDKMCYLKFLHRGPNIRFYYILINIEHTEKCLLNVTVNNETNIYVRVSKTGGVSNTQANVLSVPVPAYFCPDRPSSHDS